MTRMGPDTRAALAPVILVSVYAAIVLLSSRVAAEQWSLLFLNHLQRNYRLLPALLGMVVLAGLVVPERRAAPLTHMLAFLRERWRADRLFSLFVPPVFFALLLASFNSFKQFILPSAGFGLDPTFAAVDRLLFLGVDPWRVTHWLVPSAVGTWLIDIAYALWFLPLLLFTLCSWVADLRLRTRFLVAFALIWIALGTVMAMLLPASGPIYTEIFHGDPNFSDLQRRLGSHDDTLRAHGNWGLLAISGQRDLLEAFQTRETMLVGGISAMPSLHNALAVLFACAGYAFNRTFGIVLGGFAALILFGSVHLGWHYAIDGLVGGAMAIWIWRWSGHLADLLIGSRPSTAADRQSRRSRTDRHRTTVDL